MDSRFRGNDELRVPDDEPHVREDNTNVRTADTVYMVKSGFLQFIVLLLTSMTLTVAQADDSASFFQTLEYRGNVTAELRVFPEDSVHEATQNTNLSISAEAEFFYPFADGNSSLLVTPFVRLDENDSRRTHFDFREFLYQRNGDNWEIQIGLGKVFWGVAESVNVVDVVNQRDFVEGFLDNEKLGQPMVQLSWIRDNGSLDFFILPAFREQTFAGADGRPRFPPVIDIASSDTSSFTDGRNVDFAARYSTSVSVWDLGFSLFDGTDRNPQLLPIFGETLADLRLQPVYTQITQAGIDAQATIDSWLLKFEGIFQRGDDIESHIELVTGFEYSFFGVFDSDADIGLIGEYLFDERDSDVTQAFQNDVLLGLRLALNDEDSSEALIGTFVDLDSNSLTLSVEASRRIGNAFTLSANAVIWTQTEDDPFLDLLADEDFVELEIAWFF